VTNVGLAETLLDLRGGSLGCWQ